MKKLIFVSALAVATMTYSAQLQAQVTDTTTAQKPSGNVLQTISGTGYNTMFATALKTSGLESTLQGNGPYTVFAPADQAFTESQSATDSLMKNPNELSEVLKNHIVEGKYTKDDIIKALSAGKGKATLTTMGGNTLTLQVNANKNLEIADAAGNTALVTVFDQEATNGVVHVINHILTGKKP